MQWRDHLPAQGLPPPHDHVDGALPVEESLDGLLLVLVDEVHIIDSQQPVIDPEDGTASSGPCKPWDQRAAYPFPFRKPNARSRCPTHTFRKMPPSRMVKWFNSHMLEARLPG